MPSSERGGDGVEESHRGDRGEAHVEMEMTVWHGEVEQQREEGSKREESQSKGSENVFSKVRGFRE